jgi:hypothetical protein
LANSDHSGGERSGAWLFDRAYFASIHERFGEVGVEIMIYLMNNARYSDGVFVFFDETTAQMHRGDSVASINSISRHISRDRSTVNRLLKRMAESGLISFVERGRRLKRGLGTGPSILTVHDFDHLAHGFLSAPRNAEPWVDTIEEPSSGEGELVRAASLSTNQIPTNQTSSRNARELVDLYVKQAGIASFDRQTAERAADDALAITEYEYVRDAVAGYADIVERTSRVPMAPDRFFLEEWRKYAVFAPVREQLR